jgi:cytochrome c-type biogenesis protein CcmF
MRYIGEYLVPGQIGHLLIILSFVASLVATFAYFKSFRSVTVADQERWKRLGRIAFVIDAMAVVGIFVILYSLIANHRYEYNYVWKYSGNDLEPKYIFSSLWSASEGSFLLWTVWHGILGIALIFTSRKWEGPVMMVLSFAQLFLATMLIGLYINNVKIGSNPFALLRDTGTLDNVPILQDIMVPGQLRADYLTQIKDGNGLNLLLQNYWMVIHPPVLFLGFASTIVPFAFAIGGLVTGRHKEWVTQALPWALFSAAILGVGIMMGAAWAYESLSFGGYWAWDPVENASLVPWFILIAGIHTLLIYKHTGRSLKATYLFLILTFIFILYSTFLTRSGILSDTSVHSFGDLGMEAQLLIFFLIFFLPSLGIYFWNYKKIPTIAKEEEMSSREFWMFIASLVFFITAIVITAKTSVPIYNKVLVWLQSLGWVSSNTRPIAPPGDAEYWYNSIMVWVAVILAALTAITQYFKYKNTSRSFFWRKIGLPTLISVAVTTLLLLTFKIGYRKHGDGFHLGLWLALVASIFAIIANLSYIWLGLKGNLKLSGGSVSHLGFGMVLAGIIISSSNKEVLSHNVNGIGVPLAEGENPRENLTLVKGLPTSLGDEYEVTYTSDSVHPKKPKYYYKLSFRNKKNNTTFQLSPNAFVNYQGTKGLSANPDARHYWGHDVFIYLTSLPDPDARKNDTTSFTSRTIGIGDSLFYSKGFIILENVRSLDALAGTTVPSKDPTRRTLTVDSAYEASFKVYAKTGSIYSIKQDMALIMGEYVARPDTITGESLVFRMEGINADRSLRVGVRETESVLEYVTIKAYKFPMINMLWLGIIITAIGIFISMFRRISLAKKETIEEQPEVTDLLRKPPSA